MMNMHHWLMAERLKLAWAALPADQEGRDSAYD